MFKKTYKIFRERGYRIRLLFAAFRNHMHWSELIGGDGLISPPYKWQVLLNGSDGSVMPRVDNPVDPTLVKELLSKFPDFRRAYMEDALPRTPLTHTVQPFELCGSFWKLSTRWQLTSET